MKLNNLKDVYVLINQRQNCIKLKMITQNDLVIPLLQFGDKEEPVGSYKEFCEYFKNLTHLDNEYFYNNITNDEINCSEDIEYFIKDVLMVQRICYDEDGYEMEICRWLSGYIKNCSGEDSKKLQKLYKIIEKM